VIPISNATRGLLGGSPNQLLHNYATVDPATDALVEFQETLCIDIKEAGDICFDVSGIEELSFKTKQPCTNITAALVQCVNPEDSEEITIRKGQCLEITTCLINNCAVFTEITGEVRFVVKGTDGIAISKTSEESDIIIADQTTDTGKVSILLKSAETDVLVPGTYLYEIYTNNSDTFFRIAFGYFHVV